MILLFLIEHKSSLDRFIVGYKATGMTMFNIGSCSECLLIPSEAQYGSVLERLLDQVSLDALRSLSKALYPLLRTGSTQETYMTEKLLTGT